jgi:hypothetical protein
MRMKQLLILLTLFVTGCSMNNSPDENGKFTYNPGPPLHTNEPYAIPCMTGRMWYLEGIYNMVTEEMTPLNTGIEGDMYSLVFDTDSTAKGEIINSKIVVRLSAPFFTFVGKNEVTDEAKLFTQIASGISGCEYNEGGDRLKFYNEDNKTCLVYKLAGVREMTGRITYLEIADEWGIVHWFNIKNVILYDGGAEIFFPSEPLPDNFKIPGAEVVFNGRDVAYMKSIPIKDSPYMYSSTTLFYNITLTDLKLVDQ